MTVQDLETILSFFVGIIIGNCIWYLVLLPWLEKNYYSKRKEK
jgi:hypothetical protein